MKRQINWIFEAPESARLGWTRDAEALTVYREFELPKASVSIGFTVYPNDSGEWVADGEVLNDDDRIIMQKSFEPSIDGLMAFYEWADKVVETATTPAERADDGSDDDEKGN